MRLNADTDHPVSKVVRWFFLTGDRRLVSLVVLLAIAAAFLAVGLLRIATVTTATRVMWYLNGTVNGLLTLVPISVGVNQIVLSHEFGSVDDLYERRTDVTDFRERVEETTGTEVTSPYASEFFGTLLSSVAETARRLRRRGEGDETPDGFDETVDAIVDEADRMHDRLGAGDTSMLRTLLVVLGYENSAQYHEVRRFQNEFPGDEPAADDLQRINELFVQVDTARQFLKTVVVERQLARLSRLLIYTGIPAVTIAAIGIFSYRDIVGVTLPHAALVVVAGTIIVATLVPLVLLGAYVLRVATIARLTATYGPFVTEDSD